MAGLGALISKIKGSRRARKQLKGGACAGHRIPKWVLEIHARAKQNVWPFNPPEPESDDWYYDGEQYRQRGDEGDAKHNDSDDRQQHSNEPSRREEDGMQEEEAEAPSRKGLHLLYEGRTHWFEDDGVIGRGREGVVNLFKNGHTKLVVKVVDADMIQGKVRAPNEYVILKAALDGQQHPNIIKLYTCLAKTRTAEALLIMEYCPGGSVEALVQRFDPQRKRPTTKFLIHFIVSMAEALGYLHEGIRATGLRRSRRDPNHQRVIHRDIRLSNILVRWNTDNKRGLPDLVIADFGAAQVFSRSQGAFITPGLNSPEIPKAQQMGPDAADEGAATPATDIYALGVCISKLLCCGKDLKASGLQDAYNKSGLKGTDFTFEFLQKCLSVAKEGRPSTAELFDVGARLKARLGLMAM